MAYITLIRIRHVCWNHNMKFVCVTNAIISGDPIESTTFFMDLLDEPFKPYTHANLFPRESGNMLQIETGKKKLHLRIQIWNALFFIIRPSFPARCPSYPIPAAGWSLWHGLINRSLCPKYQLLKTSGPWFNIKMLSYQYRKSHCGDKTILLPSNLHNGISYTCKTTSLYWIFFCTTKTGNVMVIK